MSATLRSFINVVRYRFIYTPFFDSIEYSVVGSGIHMSILSKLVTMDLEEKDRGLGFIVEIFESKKGHGLGGFEHTMQHFRIYDIDVMDGREGIVLLTYDGGSSCYGWT